MVQILDESESNLIGESFKLLQYHAYFGDWKRSPNHPFVYFPKITNQSVSLTAHSHFNGLIVKPLSCSFFSTM